MVNSVVARHTERVLRVANDAESQGGLIPNEAISSSWRRCATEYSLDPARLYDPTVIGTNALKDRQAEHDELVRVAVPEMDLLHDSIQGSGYVLLLTDASGIILHKKVDPTLTRMFTRAGLVVGADWSERYEGTNGIGTCIAENRPVTVHCNEHFRACHIELSCSGSPIHDPAGFLVAVLDASVVGATGTRGTQSHTMALVNMSARLIEKYLFLRRYQHATILRIHLRPEFVNLAHDGVLALGADGTIIAVDDTAVRLLGMRARRDLTGRPIDGLFDVNAEELISPASSARYSHWPVRDVILGRRYFVSLNDSRAAAGPEPPRRGRAGRTVMHVSAAPRETLGNGSFTLDELAGDDPLMLRNVRSATRIADFPVPVMIEGPTGSGKECFARALHAASRRARQPFVAVNCAAIPETLIESELFGYKAGAFTGASKEGMRGKIAQSSGGTLFLDEIGDMPLALQTRLLRVLEQQEVLPLGAEMPIDVELHVVCATHHNLREMVAQGAFREDLYYRLNGITLELPTLAARSDKERLIRQLLAEETHTHDGNPAAIETDAFEKLLRYRWPGNIRELRNVIRTALAICDASVIRVVDLPSHIRSAAAPSYVAPRPPVAPPQTGPLEAAEREAMLKAIHDSGGNLLQAAAALGVSRTTLYRKLKQHRITVSRVPQEVPASP